MITMFIIFALFIILGLIIVAIIVTSDNLREYVIRVNEAEANIEGILSKRYDLLNKAIDVIRNITKEEGDILKKVVELRSQKLDNIALDKELYLAIEEFHNYAVENEVLKNNDEYANIEIGLISSESEIIALKKYYNDVVTKYNNLVSKFPTMLIAKIKHYEKKETFSEESHMDLINSLKQE